MFHDIRCRFDYGPLDSDQGVTMNDPENDLKWWEE